jgi:hypothetical protein
MSVQHQAFALICGFIFACFGGGSFASPVYSGCAAATPNPSGNVWYVDPVKGSMSGNGSAAHPWHTLAEVFQAGLFATTPTIKGSGYTVMANPPIQPGDTVYLLSGDHGSVKIQGWYGVGNTLVGFANSSYITIAALPGQTPVIDNLQIIGGSHWAFSGVTFQGLNTTGVYPQAGGGSQDYWLVTLRGPHDNIVFDNSTIQSATDVSGWTMGQWLTQRSSGILDTAGTCIAITNSLFHNIGFAMQTQQSDMVLIQNNTVNYFSDDGIDYGSSDLLIQQNLIENSVEDGDGFHRDGMQGQPYNEQTLNQNVVINSNTVIRLADPSNPYPGQLQGIDAFDGLWNNLVVTNNVIITDANQALSYYGAQNITVSNNYVVEDSGLVFPCYGITLPQCQTLSLTYDTSQKAAINIYPSKAGLASSSVTISNNITNELYIDPTTTNWTLNNNLCLPINGKCTLALPVNGTMSWIGAPGTYTGHTVIPQFPATSMFVKFDTTDEQYNMQLAQPNPALN